MSEEAERLRAAIIKHRSQKADDRCIEDDDELYAALGDGIPCDRRVGDKAAMLQNCARFIERRCEGGGWSTYAELEAQLAEARAAISEAEAAGVARGRALQQQWRSIESAPPTRKFISGQGWVPKDKPYVLAVDVKGRMSVGYTHQASTGETCWTFAKPIGRPTHWMPLPEPPSEAAAIEEREVE